MATRDFAANEAKLPRGTLVDLFLEGIDEFGDKPAFRYFEGEELKDVSCSESYRQVQAVAGALRAAGLGRGDRAAIISENRPEWALADFGCLCAGVIDVPIYSTLTPAQVGYILRDSGARLVFAEDADQVEKIREALQEGEPDGDGGRDGGSEVAPAGGPRGDSDVGIHGGPAAGAAGSPQGGGAGGSGARRVRIVAFDPPSDPGDDVVSWADFVASGDGAWESDDAFREEARKAAPDDVATIIYTSGTTGDPKGVMLTHDNVHSNTVAAGGVLPVGSDDVTLSFLPKSHVFQRMVDYLLFGKGCVIAFPHSIDTVADDLRVVRPTIEVSVPRLYEKVYNKVMEAEGVKRVLIRWARDVGDRWAEARLHGREPDVLTRLQYALADRLVFKKIRAGVGGRLRFFVSGGGKLNPTINRFFYSAGLTVVEGYGLTETSPVLTVNPPERIKIGTVGPPVAGTEIRIAGDGEILVRGPQVMKGYYGKPEETRKTVDEEGWLATGDIGELDDDGYLTITDRKKDIMVTAGGKNVAPQAVENRLTSNPHVEQAVMVGDGRKFLSILVVPGFPKLEAYAKEKGISFSDRRELLENEDVQGFMEGEIYGDLEDFARHEQPKKVGLLTEEFTVEDGSLTPTQKVKRRVVEERYAELIERFYRSEDRERTIFLPEEGA